MGWTTVASESTKRTALVLRSLLLLAFALAWMAASGNVHAAKDKAMCDGVKGAAKGVCTAAAALSCGTSAKHQKQCDVLGDKFEALTGQVPPWEPPPPPPPPVGGPLLMYDIDTFTLGGGTVCEGTVAIPCIFAPPSDFWVAQDLLQTDSAILMPVGGCVASNYAVAVVANTPYASVTLAMFEDLVLQDNVAAVPFGLSDTLVMRTCEGMYYKIGNWDIDADGVTFSAGPLE
jgi:hypothetical protein